MGLTIEFDNLNSGMSMIILSFESFFKVANVRHSQLLESHFKGIILAKIITSEGRTIKYEVAIHPPIIGY